MCREKMNICITRTPSDLGIDRDDIFIIRRKPTPFAAQIKSLVEAGDKVGAQKLAIQRLTKDKGQKNRELFINAVRKAAREHEIIDAEDLIRDKLGSTPKKFLSLASTRKLIDDAWELYQATAIVKPKEIDESLEQAIKSYAFLQEMGKGQDTTPNLDEIHRRHILVDEKLKFIPPVLKNSERTESFAGFQREFGSMTEVINDLRKQWENPPVISEPEEIIPSDRRRRSAEESVLQWKEQLVKASPDIEDPELWSDLFESQTVKYLNRHKSQIKNLRLEECIERLEEERSEKVTEFVTSLDPESIKALKEQPNFKELVSEVPEAFVYKGQINPPIDCCLARVTVEDCFAVNMKHAGYKKGEITHIQTIHAGERAVIKKELQMKRKLAESRFVSESLAEHCTDEKEAERLALERAKDLLENHHEMLEVEKSKVDEERVLENRAEDKHQVVLHCRLERKFKVSLIKQGKRMGLEVLVPKEYIKPKESHLIENREIKANEINPRMWKMLTDEIEMPGLMCPQPVKRISYNLTASRPEVTIKIPEGHEVRRWNASLNSPLSDNLEPRVLICGACFPNVDLSKMEGSLPCSLKSSDPNTSFTIQLECRRKKETLQAWQKNVIKILRKKQEKPLNEEKALKKALKTAAIRTICKEERIESIDLKIRKFLQENLEWNRIEQLDKSSDLVRIVVPVPDYCVRKVLKLLEGKILPRSAPIFGTKLNRAILSEIAKPAIEGSNVIEDWHQTEPTDLTMPHDEQLPTID